MSTNAEFEDAKVSSWWEQKDFDRRAKAALKTGLAAILCMWLGNMLGLVHSYWAAVSAIVVWALMTHSRSRPAGIAF